jgi:HEAT repeat protein
MVTTEEWIDQSLERIRGAMAKERLWDLDDAVYTLYPLQQEIAERAEVRTVLIAAASNPDGPSEKAIRLLGYLGCVEALPVFANALASQALRNTVLEVLPRVGGPEAVIKPLHTLLEKPDATSRLRAIHAAGALGQAVGVIGVLERGMADPDGSVRAAAVEQLGHLASVGSSAAVAALLDDPEELVRHKAVAASASFDDDLAMATVPRGLSDSSEAVRLATVQALASIHDVRVMAHLRDALGDPSPRVRAATVYGLSHVPVAWAWLTPMMSDPDFAVRLAVIECSATAPSRSARRVLRKALTDERPQVREEAARALHDRRGAYFAVLQRKALRDPSARVRRAVVHESHHRYDRWEYEEFAPGEAAQLDRPTAHVLRRALRDVDPKVRAEALEWLIGTGDGRTIGLFGEVLRHGDRALRRRTVEALCRRRGPGTVPLLRAASRDTDPAIRRLARDCLQSLTATGLDDDQPSNI